MDHGEAERFATLWHQGVRAVYAIVDAMRVSTMPKVCNSEGNIALQHHFGGNIPVRARHVLDNADQDAGDTAAPPPSPPDASPLTTRGEILTFPDTPTTQGLSLWCFNTVGGEILTFPDTPTTQGLSLWCFNTVQPATPSAAAYACPPHAGQPIRATSTEDRAGPLFISSPAAPTPPLCASQRRPMCDDRGLPFGDVHLDLNVLIPF